MRLVAFLCACLSLCAAVFTYAQPSESLIPTEHFLRLTRLVLKDGSPRVGWLVGANHDFLVIRAGGKLERISRHELLRVVVDGETQKSQTALAGICIGMYLGNALALKAEDQPFAFVRAEPSVGLAAWNIVFAAAGGGIGYLVGSSLSSESVFDFGVSEELNAAVWAELTGTSQSPKRGTVHIICQAAWVSGALPHPNNSNQYRYQSSTRLNMMRKLQLTYSLTDYLDVGVAALWLAQPSVREASYGYQHSTSHTINMNGRGYYAVAVLQPVWKLGWRSVQWDVGAGAGVASIDFAGEVVNTSYAGYAHAQSVSCARVRTRRFSVLLFTEVKGFITSYCSVGLTADVACIPEHVPVLPGVTFESTTFGSTSVGLVLGLHL